MNDKKQYIQFRISSNDKVLLAEKAKTANSTVSEYLIERGLGTYDEDGRLKKWIAPLVCKLLSEVRHLEDEEARNMIEEWGHEIWQLLK